VAAVKKDREPSEKGPEGSLALSRCAGTKERSGGVRMMSGCAALNPTYLLCSPWHAYQERDCSNNQRYRKKRKNIPTTLQAHRESNTAQ